MKRFVPFLRRFPALHCRQSRSLLGVAAFLLLCALPQLAVPAEEKAGNISAPQSMSREEPWEGTPGLPEAVIHQWTGIGEEPQEFGVEPERLRRTDQETATLTLTEAIHVALANNPRIAAQRLIPVSVKQEILKAQARYDAVFSFNLSKNLRQQPTGSVLSGASALKTKNIDFGSSLRKRFGSGSEITAAFSSHELQSNSNFQTITPQYQPEFNFTFTQPLLRNAGFQYERLRLRVPANEASMALFNLQVQVGDFVEEVIETYWKVVQAGEDLKAQQDALRLAEDQVKQNEARVQVGLLAPVAVLEVRAEAARRQTTVITATNSLDLARKRLRQLLNFNPTGAFIPRAIEPVDRPRVEPVSLDHAAVLARAVERRPELVRARLDIQTQKMQVRLAENDLLPRFDIQASWGLNGLSGRSKVVQVRDPATGQVTSVKSIFNGDYGDALDVLFNDRFYQFSAGITLEVPLDNSTAKAEYAQKEIALNRAVLAYRDLLSQVTLQVEEAIGNLEAARQRIEATRLARELAEENLRLQHRRFEVGMVTTTDLLDFQKNLTAVRTEETQALIDYNLASARLKKAGWVLLDDYLIVVEAGK